MRNSHVSWDLSTKETGRATQRIKSIGGNRYSGWFPVLVPNMAGTDPFKNPHSVPIGQSALPFLARLQHHIAAQFLQFLASLLLFGNSDLFNVGSGKENNPEYIN